MTPAEAMMNTVAWEPIESDSTTLVSDDLPYATHRGILRIGDIELQCYQLNDGRRVIDADSVAQFFDGLSSE